MAPGCRRYHRAMGFNATRRYRDGKNRDIGILIAAVVIVGALIAWATGLI